MLGLARLCRVLKAGKAVIVIVKAVAAYSGLSNWPIAKA